MYCEGSRVGEGEKKERKKLADFQLLFKYTNMDFRCMNVRKLSQITDHEKMKGVKKK